MAHSELDLRDRRKIEDMLRAKVPVHEIAVALGRHRSTIYREIGRNRFVDAELPYLTGYWGLVAQNKVVARRARRRKLIRLPALLDAVVERLKAGWPPELIAGRLRSEGQAVTVSHETIYAHVYSREGRAAEVARHLPDRRRQRRSITFDRGIEFSGWRRLQNEIGTEALFCDPQAPWQKGAVENFNKRARRYLPRETVVAEISDRPMAAICA